MSEPLRARKSLGQNFLVDENIQRRIVDALGFAAHDVVLEIGPGQGALTRHLVERAMRVVAVELDDRLAAALRVRFAGHAGFTLVHQDALDFEPAEHGLDPPSLFVVGNIPYNITTPLLFHLLAPERRPATLVVMVQKEVADRITAKPGSREYGALSVGVQSVADAERLFVVKPGSFRPVPQVDSAVVRIVPHRPRRLSDQEERDLRELTRILFSWRRKQLQKTLRTAPAYSLTAESLQRILDDLGLHPGARPETLAPEQFVRLTRALRAMGLPEEHRTQ